MKTRLVIRLLTGLFTPEPSRGVIIGKLPVTGKWNLAYPAAVTVVYY